KKECSPHEVKQVLEWFRGQGLKSEHEGELRKMWGEAEKEQKDFKNYYDAEELLRFIQCKIEGEEKNPFHKRVAALNPRPWSRLMKIAAVLFIPLVCSCLVLFHNKMGNDIQPPAEV